ncbi:hypothetical protein C8J57DRAFT_1714528 [Mycena rebaudengoi]|nr:hypothetical protein C8J57DRAFT_1714528 [Mycena rebaudengoi]
MGQYWKLINLDKQKTFGNWGKLGEFLFHHAHADDLETALRGSTLPALALLFPPLEPGGVYREGRSGRPTLCFPLMAPPSSSTALIALPNELIHAIFAHLDVLLDLACLSIACQALYAVGREHMYRHIAHIVAGYSWGGDRIICAGDYLQNEDIPAGILTAAETDALQGPEDYEDEDEYEDGDARTWSLYSFPYTRMGRVPLPMYYFWVSHCSFYAQESGRFVRDNHVLQNLYRTPEPAPAPNTDPAFLRNLSRRKYVCEAALRALQAKYAGSRVKMGDVSLAEAALVRICFSSDDSIATPYQGGLHQGVWAGDRFDIVEGTEWLGGEWVDASAEVLKELEDIWCAEYL